ncbi:MAG: metalloregulator ArsR/SmtB family transcription factor [Geovibrio sp.]|uniref:ArsR/SmtB family transcription factor n=1 Tax=Geovibrio ferrireducens TaxID=46201 RepID=UPI00224668BC|nr:metalloregulator ArsR/SmtB family transcription factor [Geovibrio ferrireducens]MCD8568776.1 metalloregulator ArsR/SmtB family transcription factor [Geovibrio sp.]
MVKETEKDLCEERCIHPQTICLVRQNMLDEGTIYDLSEMFKVLSEPSRIRILHALSRQELCVCDLADALGMNQSAISHQLRILRNARLVKFRREGKEAWYSLDDEHVITLMCQGIEHISHGREK